MALKNKGYGSHRGHTHSSDMITCLFLCLYLALAVCTEWVYVAVPKWKARGTTVRLAGEPR